MKNGVLKDIDVLIFFNFFINGCFQLSGLLLHYRYFRLGALPISTLDFLFLCPTYCTVHMDGTVKQWRAKQRLRVTVTT